MLKKTVMALLIIAIKSPLIISATKYGISEDDIFFSSLRKCCLTQFENIRRDKVDAIRDNVGFFYAVCAEKYPDKVSLEIFREDVTQHLLGRVKPPLTDAIIKVINACIDNEDFSNSPLEGFCTNGVAGGYRYCLPEIDQISITRPLFDIIEQSPKPKLKLGLPGKFAKWRVKNRQAISAYNRDQGVTPEVTLLDASSVIPSLISSNCSLGDIPEIIPALGTMTSNEILTKLKECIKGQDRALLELAVVGQQILLEKALSEKDPTWKFRAPHRLLFGETGTGKTYSIRTLAEVIGIPFIEINAPGLVNEGIVGTSLSAAYIPLKKTRGVEKYALVLVDEIGKMASTHWGDAVMKIILAHMNGINVVLPKDNANTTVNTSCFTYIGADACSALHKPLDEITDTDLEGRLGMSQELLGRFTGKITLKPHNTQSLLEIIRDGKDGPYQHAQRLFQKAFTGRERQALRFSIEDEGLITISERAALLDKGARSLDAVFSSVIQPVMADPNKLIAAYNAEQKKLESERDNLGYRLKISENGQEIEWVLEKSFIEKHLPALPLKQKKIILSYYM